MPTIEYGNAEGRYFTQWRFDELAGLARELAEAVPDATGWNIWYDAYHDYHRLEFDEGGRHYAVRYYKVFCVSKDWNEAGFGPGASKTYGRTTGGVVSLFQSGRHRTWADKA